jgi:hypothetical protein
MTAETTTPIAEVEQPRDQAATRLTFISSIISSSSFARGFDDIRSGRPPAFDAHKGWEYERGRLFGAIAPRSMSLSDKRGRINELALRLLSAAFKRGLIL